MFNELTDHMKLYVLPNYNSYVKKGINTVNSFDIYRYDKHFGIGKIEMVKHIDSIIQKSENSTEDINTDQIGITVIPDDAIVFIDYEYYVTNKIDIIDFISKNDLLDEYNKTNINNKN